MNRGGLGRLVNEAIDKPPIQGCAKDKGDLPVLVRGDTVGHPHLDYFVAFF